MTHLSHIIVILMAKPNTANRQHTSPVQILSSITGISSLIQAYEIVRQKSLDITVHVVFLI